MMDNPQGANDSANYSGGHPAASYVHVIGNDVAPREVEPPPSQQVDPWLYRILIGFLGVAMILAILLIGLLSYQGKTGSDLLIAVPSAVVAGLIGMLVPSPVRK